MKLIYIAGPYTAKTDFQRLQNIQAAREANAIIWGNGAAAICPHMNTAHLDGAPGTSNRTWLDGYLEILYRCDAVYFLEGWRRSNGCILELREALLQHKRTFYTRIGLLNYINECV